MKLIDINESHLNKTIEFKGIISDIEVKKTRAGGEYADIVFMDSTNSITIKYWDYTKNKSKFDNRKSSTVYLVSLEIGEYNGQMQYTLKKIKELPSEEFNFNDFIPKSSWDYKSLEKGLEHFYSIIKTEELKKLIDIMIFKDENYKRYTTYPAAKGVHHNYYHGILQHTLEILKYAYTVSKTKNLTEKQLDRLIVIGFLHDWAKIIEYKALPEVGITDEGKMLGHIFLGAHETLNNINNIEGFKEEDKLVIINGILSHHGFLEFGSPVLPKTVEAQIIHQCDKLSGDIESILSFTEENKGAGNFTPKLWNTNTEYYKK